MTSCSTPTPASTNLERMLGVAGAVIGSGLNWSDRNILCLAKTAITTLLERNRKPGAPSRKILVNATHII